MVHPGYGSMEYRQAFNLNTSYVMVHHDLTLSTSAISKFKYILCYGSSIVELIKASVANYLNTSYVMVHLAGVVKITETTAI